MLTMDNAPENSGPRSLDGPIFPAPAHHLRRVDLADLIATFPNSEPQCTDVAVHLGILACNASLFNQVARSNEYNRAIEG